MNIHPRSPAAAVDEAGAAGGTRVEQVWSVPAPRVPAYPWPTVAVSTPPTRAEVGRLFVAAGERHSARMAQR